MASRQCSLWRQRSFAAENTAGLDEAGRGCLAGPVVAAAVILPGAFKLPGLDDSKKLRPLARDILATQIRQCALAWSLGVIWPKRIDRINILNATFEAMSRAVFTLGKKPELLLIDGDKRIPEAIAADIWGKNAAMPAQRAIVGGDALVPVISAASILAKTWRDKLMAALGRRWPGYGFEKHKGYGTKAHYAAINELGPCPIHRLTFRGVERKQESL